MLGTSTRASDSRIFMYFVINLIFVAICYLVGSNDRKLLSILVVALSFLSSHNLLFSLGINKPFRKENERLKEQNIYADIVFKNKSQTSNAKEIEDQKNKRLMLNLVASVVVGIVVVVCAMLFSESKVFN